MPSTQLDRLPFGLAHYQLSSQDLTGGNNDGGSYDDPLGSLLPHTYVRIEHGDYVLADEPGPGCLVRMWMTAGTFQTQGDPSSFGNLQLCFDGSSTPAVNEPVADFFAGKDPRFPIPLVNNYLNSSGGNHSYVPFCFARRLKVRVTGALATPQNYFQLRFLRARPGTAVRTFDSGGIGAAQAAARELGDAGAPPSAAPTASALAPGRTFSLPTLAGSGTIRYLQISVKPFNIATLDALALQVAVDGSSHPQIDVPARPRSRSRVTRRARPILVRLELTALDEREPLEESESHWISDTP
jgi:hypothetical protein